MVGTFGSIGARRGPVTTSGLSLPAAMCWVAVLTSIHDEDTCPPSRSVTSGAAPL